MKCKDISDKEILEVLLTTRGTWANHREGLLGEYLSKIPPKLGLAKLRQLLNRKLISGCACGCRGDWEITDLGLDFLNKNKI